MSGLELGAVAFGTAGTAATATTAATAATTGLFGSAGAFSAMTTLGTVGTALSAGSLLAGGLAQGGAADYNAEAASQAALASEDAAARNAFALERKNRIEAEQLSKAQQQAKARRNVAQGTSGVTLAGSPIAVESGAAWQDEFNLTQMQQTGAMEVENVYYSATQQAAKLRTQSALDSYMGTTARTTGALSAGGTLLVGGAKKYGGSIYGA